METTVVADKAGVAAAVFLIVLVTSVWVGFDARSRDWSDNSFADRPWKWLVGSLLPWFVGFPMYLVKRGQAASISAQPMPEQPPSQRVVPGWTAEQLAAAASPGSQSRSRSFRLEGGGSVPRWVWITLGGVVVLGFIWNTGALDHTLYHVGLQRHDCYQNGFGAVFCGDEATQYQNHLRDVGLTP